jgi:hypothetical protein
MASYITADNQLKAGIANAGKGIQLLYLSILGRDQLVSSSVLQAEFRCLKIDHCLIS